LCKDNKKKANFYFNFLGDYFRFFLKDNKRRQMKETDYENRLMLAEEKIKVNLNW
jgi:hypothetical protein